MVVLGIDLGLRICGYVICRLENREICLLKQGEINTISLKKLGEKLKFIYEMFKKEIEVFKPQILALEKLYSHYRHPTTLGLLAQVRGVLVLLAEEKNISLFECGVTRARKAILGRGLGNSLQVKKMAENIMGKSFRSSHIADAFSLVFTFSHIQNLVYKND